MTPLDELDLARVHRGRDIGDKRAVKRVDGAARTRRCAVEHAGELVGGLEDGEDAASCGAFVYIFAVVFEAENLGEVRHVLGEEEEGHVCGAGLHGGREGLAAPYCCDGGVACEGRLALNGR